jgi:hypothetical protein
MPSSGYKNPVRTSQETYYVSRIEQESTICSSETLVRLIRAARRHVTEDNILHYNRCESIKSYIALTNWALYRRRNVSPVRYELDFCIREDGILHSHRRENLKSFIALTGWAM